MKTLFQLTTGLLAALAMVAFVFGALLLSLSEDTGFAMAGATAEVEQSPTSATTPVTPPPGITLVVSSPTPSPSMAVPGPTLCPAPLGWRLYTVRAGDQIDILAAEAGVPVDQLVRANCLISATLLPGTLLYLPPLPTATSTATAAAGPSITPIHTFTVAAPAATNTPPQASCGPVRGWVLYTVQPNDTLFKLSQAFGVSVWQLQQANCLNSNLIRAGTRIYVPNIPTRTPVIQDTATPTPTLTETPAPPSLTPTDTLVPVPSDTPTPTIETPTETATHTVSPAGTEPSATETTPNAPPAP
jgi:LysM repeat protein